MGQVVKHRKKIAKATASGERIINLLEVVPKIKDNRGAITAPRFWGKVEFKNVTFGYEPNRHILQNISFTLQPGQKVALVGPEGGGKSTLVSLLLRLYDPLEGQILVDGHNIKKYKLDSLRKQISIVLSDSFLFATTIRENIAYGCISATEQAIRAAATLADANDFIMSTPDGYHTVLGERGKNISREQRQRIAIARAAVRKAPIVILDEPTTGLDNKSKGAVTEAIDRLTSNSTTFLITQDLRTSEQADQIFYIEKGQILERGTHSELMNLGEHYATLYRLQTTNLLRENNGLPIVLP